MILALLLSIAIHMLGVLWVHWSLPTPHDPPENTTLSQILILRHMTRTPPPAPTPHPAHSPQPPAPTSRPPLPPKAVQAPRVASKTGPLSGAVMPQVRLPSPTLPPAPSPEPTVTVAPTAGCVASSVPAALKTLAPPPEMSAQLRQRAKSGLVRVHVRLSETGEVLETGIALSSGNDAQDQLAVTQAKNTLYTPALQHCKAVAGSYDFTAKFVIP